MVNFPASTDTILSDITHRLKAIVGAQLGVDPNSVVDTANFSEDLHADSLEVVQIVMEIEEEFGLEVSDADADTILTVGDAIRYIYHAKI